MRQTIAAILQSIQPFDALEMEHLTQTLAWIASGAPLFRIQKPATPPQHLVSYFVLFDPALRKILLVDHKKAGLWLPAGGHVEPDEDPQQTVVREAEEELQITADFLQTTPLFFTVTETVGIGTPGQRHSISMSHFGTCYSIRFDEPLPSTKPNFTEFNGLHWISLPLERCDPHLQRFVDKVVQY